MFRKPPPESAVKPAEILWLSYLGVLLHVFMDFTNSYGVRLLMPFSERWFYGDALYIVDPWLYLILGLGLVAGQEEPRDRRVSLWRSRHLRARHAGIKHVGSPGGSPRAGPRRTPG